MEVWRHELLISALDGASGLCYALAALPQGSPSSHMITSMIYTADLNPVENNIFSDLPGYSILIPRSSRPSLIHHAEGLKPVRVGKLY